MKPVDMVVYFSLLLTLTVTLSAAVKDVTVDNCEVCVKFMTRFIDSLDSNTKSTPAKIEDAFRKFCKDTKKDDNRFCYYVGGLETSATGMLGVISQPISWGVPADKVCLKIKRKDAQICDLKYDKEIDLSKVILKKLKVSELKKILSDWDETCRGCAEKTDYVKRVEELMPIHAPDSHAKRTEL